MVWVLISASFSTFTYMSAAMPTPASPLSLHPFVSSAFFVHRTHPMSKGLLSLFIYFFYQFLSASLHSLFILFFPWYLLPAPSSSRGCSQQKKKKKHDVVVGSETSGMGLHKVARSFSSPSPGSNTRLWHQCTGSNHPGDVRSEICPLFPQVML